MHRILWIIIVIFNVSAEKRYGFHPIDSLAGNVKTIRESNCRARKKRNGKIVVRTMSCKFFERKYLNDGKIWFDTIRATYGTGWTRYYYDDHGHLTKKQRKIPGAGIEDEMRYTYDEKGNCIEESNYDSHGNLDESKKFKLTYDAQSHIAEVVEFNEEGEFEERCTDILYDYQGNIVSKITIDGDGDSSKDSSYFVYDEKGLIIREVKFDGRKLDWTRSYHYTADGKTASINKTVGKMKAFDDCDTFTYDADGHLVKYIDYDENKSIQRKMFDFTYDQRGNWIYSLMEDDDKDLYVRKREISYY
ncbi:MAG: hypothetical protein JW913_12615 [Chitinispirillaceae bacterium]|nr:hypothetical protein [Chitinispirillaceae bacterium]